MLYISLYVVITTDYHHTEIHAIVVRIALCGNNNLLVILICALFIVVRITLCGNNNYRGKQYLITVIVVRIALCGNNNILLSYIKLLLLLYVSLHVVITTSAVS